MTTPITCPVSVESINEEQALKVTTSISKNADGFTADLDRGGSVTVTIQLVDTAVTATEAQADNTLTEGAAAEGAKNVARAGIEITVGVTRSSDPDSDGQTAQADVVYNNTTVTTLTTDDDGKATFVVDAPEDDNDKNDEHINTDDGTGTDYTASANLENRNDLLTFNHKAVEGRSGSAAQVQATIMWSEDHPVTTSASSSAPAYVLPDKDGDLAITASLTLYDQYGNGIREGGVGQQAAIGIGLDAVNGDPGTDGTDNVNVNRNGVATRRVVIKKVAGTTDNNPGTPIFVGFAERPQVDDDDPATTNFTGVDQADVTAIVAGTDNVNLADNQSVQVVTEADDDDVDPVTVNALRATTTSSLRTTAPRVWTQGIPTWSSATTRTTPL